MEEKEVRLVRQASPSFEALRELLYELLRRKLSRRRGRTRGVRKCFVVTSLKDVEKVSQLSNCLIVGFRTPSNGKDVFFKQNITFYPEDRGRMSFDPERGELTITLKINKNEYLALGDDNEVGKGAEEV